MKKIKRKNIRKRENKQMGKKLLDKTMQRPAEKTTSQKKIEGHQKE